MNFKRIILAATFTSAAVVLGFQIPIFPTWAAAMNRSHEIIIARCTKSLAYPNESARSFLISDIEILLSLKGRTNLGSARLASPNWCREGDCYLIFGAYTEGYYSALKVMPLGRSFQPNSLTNKPLAERIQLLKHYCFDELKHEMQNEEEEKQWLDEEIKKSPGWDNIIGESHDIIVAGCTKTEDSPTVLTNGLIDSEVDIVRSLKGRTNVGPARLASAYWPRRDTYYLIFSTYSNNAYQAIEKHSMIPISSYGPDSSSDKTMDEQIQSIFQYYLFYLTIEIKETSDELLHLEVELKK